MSIVEHIVYVTDDGFGLIFNPIEDTVRVMETNGGFEVRYLTSDPNSQSPDDDRDDSLFLVHYHRSFHVARDNVLVEDDARNWYQDHPIPQDSMYWIFPVASLIHGGIWLRLGRGGFAADSGGWDTSHVGMVLASKSEWPDKERATVAAEGLIAWWNSYLSDDVYGVIRETFDAQKRPLNCESVWGYVGFDNARSALEEEG